MNDEDAKTTNSQTIAGIETSTTATKEMSILIS